MLPALDHIAYEIDLMCFDAEQAADAWLKLGATRLTFHVESSIDFAVSSETLEVSMGM